MTMGAFLILRLIGIYLAYVAYLILLGKHRFEETRRRRM